MQVQKFPLNRKQRRKVGIGEPIPTMMRMYKKLQRNDLCPCGSGLKFKNCECFEKYGQSRQYFSEDMLKEAAKNYKE